MEEKLKTPTRSPALIKSLYQVDTHHFTIEWSSGLIKTYRLKELQKACPCAGCAEKSSTALSPSKNSMQEEEVQADRIISVGRYALRIEFTRGCSQGIYSFDQLMKWGEQ